MICRGQQPSETRVRGWEYVLPEIVVAQSEGISECFEPKQTLKPLALSPHYVNLRPSFDRSFLRFSLGKKITTTSTNRVRIATVAIAIAYALSNTPIDVDFTSIKGTARETQP